MLRFRILQIKHKFKKVNGFTHKKYKYENV